MDGRLRHSSPGGAFVFGTLLDELKRVPIGLNREVSFEQAIQETLRVLAESDDALVHMESLRRSYFYLQAKPSGGLAGHDPPSPEVAKLATMLKDNVLAASVPGALGAPQDIRREALAWFDLGYLLAIKQNCLHGRDIVRDISCHPLLERAAAAASHDAALQFGVAFAQLHNGVESHHAESRPETTYWHAVAERHMKTALDLTQDPSSLLGKNICALLGPNGPYGAPTTFEEIRKRMASESRPR
jgi:hypothetical protein